mmetsp:Transcript_26723/g.35112  ORF Transcript_26723/g.35112 Transcript_26723/m.35112 type:complete len:113 (-) Transcript_26723:368-706(-)
MENAGPTLEFVKCDEVSITLKFQSSGQNHRYNLEYINVSPLDQQWTDAESLEIKAENDVEVVTVQNLEPSNTFKFRLCCINEAGIHGEPGPEITLDTQVVSCAPKNRCCNVS